MTSKFGFSTVATLLILAVFVSCSGGGGGGGTSQAGVIALPRTGQTSCFDASGALIACAGTGQDGELKTGVPAPGPRFAVDGTGNCVTDNLTGLMWAKNANLPAGLQIWQQALDYADSLDLCGFTDWRLPNRTALRSLINHSTASNAAPLNALGFSNVQADGYWSSTSMAGGGATNAFIVYMHNGSVGASDKSGPNGYVWPVRAGR